MPPYRPPQKRAKDDEDSVGSNGRPAKKRGKPKKQEPTYDTYEEAMEGGVDFEEKGERYGNGERAQRNYERALELYQKAYGMGNRTFDAAYNQVLYTLGTAFYLPPASIEYLRKSLELYVPTATDLTESPTLKLDAMFNYAQAATSLADMLEEVDGTSASPEVRDLRSKAAEALGRVLVGQVQYLDEQPLSSKESTPGTINSGADGMEVDAPSTPPAEAGESGEEGEEGEAYESHLPTATSLIDTALALVDVHLDLWESIVPLRSPTPEETQIVSSVLAVATKHVPKDRQAELDLAEIKSLLSMDRIIWSLQGSTAAWDGGWDKSLEGGLGALDALLRSLDRSNTTTTTTPRTTTEDTTVKAELLVTKADSHSALAHRAIALSGQLPSGPTYLAQTAWLHLTGAIESLTQALELPKSIYTSRDFSSSVLIDLGAASLARARLWKVNETAGRNVVQLLENALAYNQKAIDGLGVGFVHLGSGQRVLSDGSHQRGWDAEALAREVVLGRIRVYLYGINTDMAPSLKERYARELESLVKGMSEVQDTARRVGPRDLERYLEDLVEEEGTLAEEEKGWWSMIAQSLHF